MLTVGHSTLPLEEFIGALADNGCELLVDVRRHPGSRRYPQYGQAALFQSLRTVGIEGVWREGLGGRRQPLGESVNLGWRNASFRGYADYMQTGVFAGEIDWLVEQCASGRGVAVMCAEAVPWRCHRSLIADAMLVRGVEVEDVFVEPGGRSYRRPHVLTSFARVRGSVLSYPREGELFG